MVVSLSACSKIKRDFFLYQATKAHDEGHYKDAIAKYKKVLEINPRDETVVYNLGAAYVADKQLDNARRQAEKLRKLEHNDFADLLQEIIDKAADRAGE